MQGGRILEGSAAPLVNEDDAFFIGMSMLAIIFAIVFMYCIYRSIFGEEDDRKAVAPVSVRTSVTRPQISETAIENMPIAEQQEFLDSIINRAQGTTAAHSKYVI